MRDGAIVAQIDGELASSVVVHACCQRDFDANELWSGPESGLDPRRIQTSVLAGPLREGIRQARGRRPETMARNYGQKLR